jgi:hypothetical protein
MTQIDEKLKELSTQRRKRFKELQANNALTDVKLAILSIEEGISTLSWTNFFSTENKNGFNSPTPITKLCSTNLVTLFEQQAKKQRYTMIKINKMKKRYNEALALGDNKTRHTLHKKLAALSEDLLEGMNPLRKPILDYFNDLTLMFKLLYSFKKGLPLEDTVDIQMSMIKLMQEVRVIRFYDLKTPFYDFNDLRNIVAHNSVTSYITEADYLAFAEMITSINTSVKEVLKNYSAPFEKAQKKLLIN